MVKAARKANGHTNYIDAGIHFVLPKIPEGYGEVILKHNIGLFCSQAFYRVGNGGFYRL